MDSPLTDPPISNGKLRGSKGPSSLRQPDFMPTGGTDFANPTLTDVNIAMSIPGRGTPGRKSFPSLG